MRIAGENTFYTLMVGQNLGKCNSSNSKTNVDVPKGDKYNGEELNKCNQCNCAFAKADNLRTHLKIHCGEKSHKCKQFNNTFSEASI